MTNGKKVIGACVGKIQYSTLESAMDELGKLTGMHIYPCPHCKQYHIGHVKKRKGV
jgi:hypothetical protein